MVGVTMAPTVTYLPTQPKHTSCQISTSPPHIANLPPTPRNLIRFFFCPFCPSPPIILPSHHSSTFLKQTTTFNTLSLQLHSLYHLHLLTSLTSRLVSFISTMKNSPTNSITTLHLSHPLHQYTIARSPIFFTHCTNIKAHLLHLHQPNFPRIPSSPHIHTLKQFYSLYYPQTTHPFIALTSNTSLRQFHRTNSFHEITIHPPNHPSPKTLLSLSHQITYRITALSSTLSSPSSFPTQLIPPTCYPPTSSTTTTVLTVPSSRHLPSIDSSSPELPHPLLISNHSTTAHLFTY